MLILTRRIGESIIIGENEAKIIVTFLASKGEQARLGIEAPKSTPVHREEVYLRIKQQKIGGAQKQVEEQSLRGDDE